MNILKKISCPPVSLHTFEMIFKKIRIPLELHLFLLWSLLVHFIFIFILTDIVSGVILSTKYNELLYILTEVEMEVTKDFCAWQLLCFYYLRGTCLENLQESREYLSELLRLLVTKLLQSTSTSGLLTLIYETNRNFTTWSISLG